ncbi:ATP-binding cassette domain-containing protein [Streptococcus danieliae]|uniref:ATP-binding cassette domain-containing protein n=1 Tax=Streptococcus danieliae TaxID=747656 RepID=A0A7Z0LE04_9STRE|nr:ATP-binding cassette domain-containing protein [Streptococcus danieliae]MBF0717824.1 ATP-binding cassette domain-containing protein [Streptococcus danieliae]NYS49754.1 ATP-binding cassette domain-containing protein [Streptococcus danieliae]
MLQCDGLEKCFGQRSVFQNLAIQFEAGKVYALVGASGRGKTTLLNILAKLESPDSGRVVYREKNLLSLSRIEFFRNDLGYLLQQGGLLENETIAANLELALVGKRPPVDKQKLFQQKLAQVHLDYLDLDQKIYELSGGEAQRVAIAKLFIKEPPLILADEPTASLDSENSRLIMDLLLSLKNPDRLIIIATHSPDIWTRADEVVEL